MAAILPKSLSCEDNQTGYKDLKLKNSLSIVYLLEILFFPERMNDNSMQISHASLKACGVSTFLTNIKIKITQARLLSFAATFLCLVCMIPPILIGGIAKSVDWNGTAHSQVIKP